MGKADGWCLKRTQQSFACISVLLGVFHTRLAIYVEMAARSQHSVLQIFFDDCLVDIKG